MERINKAYIIPANKKRITGIPEETYINGKLQ